MRSGGSKNAPREAIQKLRRAARNNPKDVLGARPFRGHLIFVRGSAHTQIINFLREGIQNFRYAVGRVQKRPSGGYPKIEACFHEQSGTCFRGAAFPWVFSFVRGSAYTQMIKWRCVTLWRVSSQKIGPESKS